MRRYLIMPLVACLVVETVGAAEAPVAEAHWITAQSDRNPAVSPEGTRLVFSSDRSGRQALYLRNLADGATSLLVGGDDMPGYPTWSPDGKWIVFTARVSGEADLFVIGADGRDRRALVTHPARDGHPRWSPDGKRVYFNSERPAAEPRTDAVTSPEGEDRVDIYSVAADGSDLRRHTQCGSECSYPSVSPDGKHLLFRRVFWNPSAAGAKPERDSEIVVADLDGGNERRVAASAAYDVYPIWSADGRWIYFSSNREGAATQLHLWRVAATGGSPQRLSQGAWSHRHAFPDPAGKRVYVFTYQRAGGRDVGFVGAIDLN